MLREIGIEHAGTPKGVEGFRHTSFDLVVTVCDSAAGECPQRLGQGHREHLGFADPAMAVGAETEVLASFRQVRDEIATKIPSLLKSQAGE